MTRHANTYLQLYLLFNITTFVKYINIIVIHYNYFINQVKFKLKDRNGTDLTEEDIKKRWQEYTELYKKDLHDQDNHDGVITHLEPDIQESGM